MDSEGCALCPGASRTVARGLVDEHPPSRLESATASSTADSCRSGDEAVLPGIAERDRVDPAGPHQRLDAPGPVRSGRPTRARRACRSRASGSRPRAPSASGGGCQRRWRAALQRLAAGRRRRRGPTARSAARHRTRRSRRGEPRIGRGRGHGERRGPARRSGRRAAAIASQSGDDHHRGQRDVGKDEIRGAVDEVAEQREPVAGRPAQDQQSRIGWVATRSGSRRTTRTRASAEAA